MQAAARRVLSGAAAWGGASAVLVQVAVPLLAQQGLVHAPATVAAALTLGAVGVLAPTGAARGALHAAERQLVPAAGDAAAAAWAASAPPAAGGVVQRRADELRDTLGASLRGDNLQANILNNSGAGGMATRGLLSVFLPSTDMVIEHVVADLGAASPDGAAAISSVEALLRAGTNGLVAGHIANARDKSTGLGLLVMAAVVGGTFMVDRAAGKAAAKKKQLEEDYAAAKEKIQASVGGIAEDARAAKDRVMGGAKDRWEQWQQQDKDDGAR